MNSERHPNVHHLSRGLVFMDPNDSSSPSTSLTIDCINIRGINAKAHEIGNHLKKTVPDILICCETFTNDPPDFNDYRSITFPAMRTSNGRLRRGLAMYLKTTLMTTSIRQPPYDIQRTQFLPTRLKDKHQKNINIIGVYHPPETELDTDYMTTIDDINAGPTLFIGDFNAHHRDINIDRNNIACNTTGTRLVQFLNDNCFDILNNDEPTHESGSRIDLAIGSSDIIQDIHDFEVHDIFNSDHALIRIKINWTHDNIRERTIYDWKSVNEDTFQEAINSKLTPLPDHITTETIDTLADNFSDAIHDAIDEVVRKKTIKIKDDWITEQTRRLIKRRNRLRRDIRRHGLHELRPEMNRLTRSIKTHIRQDKERHYKSHQRKITDGLLSNDPKKYWTIVNGLLGRNKTTNQRTLDINGRKITNDQEIADIFADHMKTVCTKPEEPPSTNLTDQMMQQFQRDNPDIFDNILPIDFIDEPILDERKRRILDEITHEELDNAIKNTKNKAPGFDNIKKKTLTIIGQHARQRFLDILNICLTYGHFPRPWKHAIVTMIPKPNKDHSNPSSYRPISLLSVPGKIFEKILNQRLTTLLDDHDHIVPTQMGFRQHRGVTDQTTLLTTSIQHDISRQRFSLLLTFDVTKAFDQTWIEGLIYKLIMNDIFPRRLLRIINSFLTMRTLQVKQNGQLSTTQMTTAGTPQGSCLSPTLFILYVNDIKDSIDNHEIKTRQFADDIAMTTSDKSIDRMEKRTNQALDRMKDYMTKWRIRLNPTKSTAMTIHQINKKSHRPPILKYDNVPIPEVTTTRYLGVTYNQKGNGNDHAKLMTANARQRIGLLRRISNDNIIPEKGLLRIYKTMIRPVLDFASPAWAHNLTKEMIMKVERTHRLGLKTSMRLPKWTPTEFMLDLAKETSMQSRHLKLGQTFLTNSMYREELLATNRPLKRRPFNQFPTYSILNHDDDPN